VRKFGLILGAVSQAVSAVAIVLSYRRLLQEIEQARRLQAQMEEDHARLVRNVIHAEHGMLKQEQVSGEHVRQSWESGRSAVPSTRFMEDDDVDLDADPPSRNPYMRPVRDNPQA